MQYDPGRGVPHANHLDNRLAYAERIIAFIDKHVPHAKAANLVAMNEASWVRTAKIAGEKNAPSLATISTIIGMFYMREKIANSIATFTSQDRLLPKVEVVPNDALADQMERV